MIYLQQIHTFLPLIKKWAIIMVLKQLKVANKANW